MPEFHEPEIALHEEEELIVLVAACAAGIPPSATTEEPRRTSATARAARAPFLKGCKHHATTSSILKPTEAETDAAESKIHVRLACSILEMKKNQFCELVNLQETLKGSAVLQTMFAFGQASGGTRVSSAPRAGTTRPQTSHYLGSFRRSWGAVS